MHWRFGRGLGGVGEELGVVWGVASVRKSAGNVRSELFSYADCSRSGTLLGIDTLLAVRFPSTHLKPAVLLLLGASTVFVRC